MRGTVGRHGPGRSQPGSTRYSVLGRDQADHGQDDDGDRVAGAPVPAKWPERRGDAEMIKVQAIRQLRGGWRQGH
jgi:hypothetical protein